MLNPSLLLLPLLVLVAGVTSWAVYGPDGKAVTAQILPLSPADVTLRGRYGAPTATTTQWLAFIPSVPIPAAGFAVYFLVPAASAEEEAPLTHISSVQRMKIGQQRLRTNNNGGADVTSGATSITNGVLTLSFDATTGHISGLTNAANGLTTALSQAWMGYIPNQGDKTNGQSRLVVADR